MTDARRESLIVTELQRLVRVHGGTLHPKAVVDAARAPESPLHQSFDWDDATASEKWRLAQARQLIRVAVSYEKVGTKQIACRVFVSLTPDRAEDGAGYRLVHTVLSDAAYRHQLLADAKAEMLRFRLKYQRLTELATVFEAMAEVLTDETAEADAEVSAADAGSI